MRAYTKLWALQRHSTNGSSFSSSKCFETHNWEKSSDEVIFLALTERSNKWVNKEACNWAFHRSKRAKESPLIHLSKDSWKAVIMALGSCTYVLLDGWPRSIPLSQLPVPWGILAPAHKSSPPGQPRREKTPSKQRYTLELRSEKGFKGALSTYIAIRSNFTSRIQLQLKKKNNYMYIKILAQLEKCKHFDAFTIMYV